jgi:hypothetical protein
METIALLGAIVMAIVFVAERLAFAVLIYMLSRWTFRMAQPVLKVLVREWLVLKGRVTLWVYAFRRWLAMRALRGQLAGGATP